MKKLLAIVFVIIFFASLGVVSVGACNWVRPVLDSFEVISNDSTSVFRSEANTEYCEYYGYIRIVHTVVYTNTEPRVQIYTIDLPQRNNSPSNLHFSDDMSYIAITMPRQNFSKFSCFISVDIFYNGDLLHILGRENFFENYTEIRRLYCCLSVGYIHNLSSTNFCAETLTLTIETTEGNTFTIDISSGEISEVQPIEPSILFFFLIFSIVAIIISGVVLFVITTRKKSTKIEVSHEPTST